MTGIDDGLDPDIILGIKNSDPLETYNTYNTYKEAYGKKC